MIDRLQPVIERAWEDRDRIGADTEGEVREAVNAAIAALDSGVKFAIEPGNIDTQQFAPAECGFLTLRVPGTGETGAGHRGA